MAHTKEQDLEAFCATCLSVEEVTKLLQAVGFALDFHMDTVPSACAEVPLFLLSITIVIDVAVN